MVPVASAVDPPVNRAAETKRLYRDMDSGKVDQARVELALADRDEELRLAGIRAYTRFPPESRDSGPLIEQLQLEPERLRLAALQGIGALGDPRSVSALAAVLRSPRRTGERIRHADRRRFR